MINRKPQNILAVLLAVSMLFLLPGCGRRDSGGDNGGIP